MTPVLLGVMTPDVVEGELHVYCENGHEMLSGAADHAAMLYATADVLGCSVTGCAAKRDRDNGTAPQRAS